MNFSWSKEYIDYKDKVVGFAQEHLNTEVSESDRGEIFPLELWKKCADFGIQGLAIPKRYGGQLDEVDFLRAMLAMEGFGFGCKNNGLAFGLNAQMWTVQTPIVHFGTEEQKIKYLNPMAQGQIIGAHALTEPQAGSDIFSMQLRAEKGDNGYVLNGKKHLITFAPICDFALVFANLNPKLGRWGISAFLVDKNTPGFSSSVKKSKMGLRSVPIGDLIFEDCLVDESCLLGKVGMGYSILNHSLEYDRCCILASQLGAMERQLNQAIDYANGRKQFDQPISTFQSVSNRISDMKLRLETSRLLLYKTAWIKDSGKSAMMEAALLKLHLSESFVLSSLDTIRTFGGIGYLEETGVERDLRDAVGGVLYAGTSDIQRNIIAKLLGL